VEELARDRLVEPVLPQVVRAGDGWAFRYDENERTEN
jgi:hypothetical protein